MGEAKEESNELCSNVKDDMSLFEISERPFSDLTDSREEQFLLDEMMNVANMKNQIRKLKIAIDDKKMQQYNKVITEMKESFSGDENAINMYSEKVGELNNGYKTRKSDLYDRREKFERSIVSLQADIAKYKKESDELRKDENVTKFIGEYNVLKNEYTRLVFKKGVLVSSEEKYNCQSEIDEKKNEINSYIAKCRDNDVLSRFIDLSEMIDSSIKDVSEKRDGLTKISEHESEINVKYNENISKAKEIRQNQLALVKQESGLLGLKKLIGKLKLKLGIGKNRSNKEILAICNATSFIGKTIEIVRNNSRALGIAVLGLEKSVTNSSNGLTQAQIVNKLANMLFNPYGSKKNQENVIQTATAYEVDNQSQEIAG